MSNTLTRQELFKIPITLLTAEQWSELLAGIRSGEASYWYVLEVPELIPFVEKQYYFLDSAELWISTGFLEPRYEPTDFMFNHLIQKSEKTRDLIKLEASCWFWHKNEFPLTHGDYSWVIKRDSPDISIQDIIDGFYNGKYH